MKPADAATTDVTAAASEAAHFAAGRAADYCWTLRPGGGDRCTRPPGHDGDYLDACNGREKPTDTQGRHWPQ